MAKKYGNTWWGEQWLNALSNIDYSNRLPRGRRYANNGSVTDIHFRQNVVSASVQGTRATPYKVNVRIPEFSQGEKDALVGLILDNPLILSKLLNRELPSELHELALDKKVQIFPDTWKDFDMKCSCPDIAVPCKHLASVIYIIANEIDRNPFIIFQLHGFDVLKALEQHGYSPGETTVFIPTLYDYAYKDIDPSDKEYVDISEVDLSVVPELHGDLLSMLDDQSLFYEGDFKKRLETCYRKVKKIVPAYLSSIRGEEEGGSHYDHFVDYELFIREDLAHYESVLYSEVNPKSFAYDSGLKQLVQFLENIPHKEISLLSQPLQALHKVYSFALKLLSQGAYIPEIMKDSENYYVLRWIPALVNEQVKRIFDKLKDAIPPKTVHMMVDGKEDFFFASHDQLNILVSEFLGFFLQKASVDFQKSGDVVESFFFGVKKYRFDALGEVELPQTIQRWISKFHIHLKNSVPLLKVEEEDSSFSLDVLVENREKPYEEPVRLEDFLSLDGQKSNQTEVLKDLTLLTSSFPQLESVIRASGKHKLTFNAEEFTPVLLQILPLIKMYGIRILLPNSLKHVVRPQPTLKLQRNTTNSSNKTFLSLDKMLDFQWQIALGDHITSPEEFFAMVKGLSGIVKIHNQYMLINPEEIDKIQKEFATQSAIKSADLVKVALTETYKDKKIAMTAEARQLIDSFLNVERVEPPEGLLAKLRPYQHRGFEWLYKNVNTGIGSILADDMGLGKTVQVISLLMKLKEKKRIGKNKALVVVPTTLLTNWSKELQKFAPGITASIYHGSSRTLDLSTDLVLTTYGIVRSDEQELGKKRWECVIIDESQNIKNPSAAQTKAVKNMKSRARIALSGTPVENRLAEYWSVFDFTNKGFLGSLKKFNENFANPIENEHNREVIEEFKTITAPFIMRRLKTDRSIIDDLPEKVENEYFARLTNEQAAVYQNVIDTIMPSIDDAQDTNNTSFERRGLIFKLIIALKQVCNHPSQYLKKNDLNPDLSGKVQLLFQLLENIYETGEKVLIFTQFKETGVMLEQMIRKQFDQSVLFIHGGVSRSKREQMIEDFQQKNYLKTFILSIKSAGTGLNLTEANHVIHFDLWWNPAVEQQATDRTYRIGQQKNVMVYRLVTRDSFEEKINAMIQSKKELANLTVNAGEKWIGDLSNEELKSIVKLD